MFKQLLTTITFVAALAAAAPSIAQTAGETTMNATTGHAAVNGVEIYYEIQGEGSPLVMLHGGVNPSDLFGAPLAEMAKTHKVIAIHMRGHGFSTDTDAPWTYEQMADDVAAVLGELDIAKTDVMGWSMGAVSPTRWRSVTPNLSAS